LGNKWTEISRRLNGRPANAIKNHWNSTLKRRLGKNGEYRKKFKFDNPEDDDKDPDQDDTDNDPLNDSITEDKSLSSNRLASTKEVGDPKKEELSADEYEDSIEEQSNTVNDSPVRTRISQNNRPHSEESEIDSYSPVIKKRKHGHDECSKSDSTETVLSSPASQISKIPHMSYPSTQYTLLFDMEEDTIPFFVDTLIEEFPFDETPISIDPLQNQNDSSNNNWSLDCYDLYRPDVNSVFNGWWLQQDTIKDPFDKTIL